MWKVFAHALICVGFLYFVCLRLLVTSVKQYRGLNNSSRVLRSSISWLLRDHKGTLLGIIPTPILFRSPPPPLPLQEPNVSRRILNVRRQEADDRGHRTPSGSVWGQGGKGGVWV